MEMIITSIMYLDRLQQFLTPQLDEDDQEGRIHLQQDGAPPHYLGEGSKYLNSHLQSGHIVPWILHPWMF
jgi:hypothetical protein